MPVYKFKHTEINYQFDGNPNQPVLVFINGITQRVQHWAYYSKLLNSCGYGVLMLDLMGQGESTKPTLFIDFRDNQNVLAGLLDHLGIERIYIAGISFGGVVALRFAIEYPERTRGVIPISTFSEMDAKLFIIGCNLYEGMTKIGFEYLVKWFTPFNFTSDWLAANQAALPAMIRTSFFYNDLYGIQNMMESLHRFEGFSHELYKIEAPTMILNAEYDSLTTRSDHEVLRKNIKNSRLVIVQRMCHAFTIQIPELTCRLLDDFIQKVETGAWEGDQTVWIAADDPKAEVLFMPCEGDYLRAIPLPQKKSTSKRKAGSKSKIG